jgi:hypothetical protein
MQKHLKENLNFEESKIPIFVSKIKNAGSVGATFLTDAKN